MRDEIIEKAKSLIDEINKFKDVRSKVENAEIQLRDAKSQNEELKRRLDELLNKHSKQVKDDLHNQILEITRAYEEVLLGVFDSQVNGIFDTLSKITSLSNEVAALHRTTLNSIETSHNQYLSKLSKSVESSQFDLENNKTQFSELLNQILLQVKDSGVQFNATSNLAQTNFKKIIDEFVSKLEAQADEGISREFVKDTIKQILQEGFDAATQEIREVAPIAKKQTDQISQLLNSVNELKEELKALNASTNKSDQNQIEKQE